MAQRDSTGRSPVHFPNHTSTQPVLIFYLVNAYPPNLVLQACLPTYPSFRMAPTPSNGWCLWGVQAVEDILAFQSMPSDKYRLSEECRLLKKTQKAIASQTVTARGESTRTWLTWHWSDDKWSGTTHKHLLLAWSGCGYARPAGSRSCAVTRSPECHFLVLSDCTTLS